MKVLMGFAFFWMVGHTAFAEKPAYDPMPLFSKILKNAANGGNPDELVKIEGLNKGSKSDPNHLRLEKDSMFARPGQIPKYKRVTFWGKVRDGKINRFHLAIHDRRDVFEKVQALIEEVYGIKFEEVEGKKGPYGVFKEMEVVKGESEISLMMSDGKVGGRDAISLGLSLEPVKGDDAPK